MTTADEVEANSMLRYQTGHHRLVVLAILGFLAIFTLAALLQVQQNGLAQLITEQRDTTIRMCEQRRINTIKTNANWTALAKIERHNRFIDDQIRRERLAVYSNAKLLVPTCA